MTFRTKHARGMTLVELICSIAIMIVLTMAALPMARVSIKREKERRLHSALDEMRKAIDDYKDACDRGLIQQKLGAECYPPDLESLVKGIDMVGQVDKKFRFLRRVPADPMMHTTEWGMRSMQDDPKSTSFGGQNVFDVFSKSQDKALDGTSYADW